MKAIRLHSVGGPEVLKYEENVDLPKLTANSVRIKNKVCGINYIDTYHRTGLYKVDLPYVPGRDGAGIIESIEGNAFDLKVGDRVAYGPLGSGSYAEYTTVPASNVVKIPDWLDFDRACTAMVQGLTAHYLVKNGSYNIKKGDLVLVHAAAGGLGQIVCQLAKILGASKVIGTTSSEEKAKIALGSGCDDVILYTKQDFVSETKRITGGRGVDVIYDSVGKDTFLKSLECATRRGHVILCGNASGKVDPFDPLLLSKGSLTVCRPSLFDYISTKEEMQERCNDLFSWIEKGLLNLSIAKTFPLKEAKEAHEFLESRKTTGKVLLIP